MEWQHTRISGRIEIEIKTRWYIRCFSSYRIKTVSSGSIGPTLVIDSNFRRTARQMLLDFHSKNGRNRPWVSILGGAHELRWAPSHNLLVFSTKSRRRQWYTRIYYLFNCSQKPGTSENPEHTCTLYRNILHSPFHFFFFRLRKKKKLYLSCRNIKQTLIDQQAHEKITEEERSLAPHARTAGRTTKIAPRKWKRENHIPKKYSRKIGMFEVQILAHSPQTRGFKVKKSTEKTVIQAQTPPRAPSTPTSKNDGAYKEKGCRYLRIAGHAVVFPARFSEQLTGQDHGNLRFEHVVTKQKNMIMFANIGSNGHCSHVRCTCIAGSCAGWPVVATARFTSGASQGNFHHYCVACWNCSRYQINTSIQRLQ